MVVRFTECFHADNGLFKDLGEYKNIADWLEKVIKFESNFTPLDCGVKYNGEWLRLIMYGKVNPDAEKMIRKIRRIPARIRNIPNDTMLIKADSFERELYINLDGE